MTESSELQTAWTRYCEDQQLSDAERVCLQQALDDEPVAQELVADQQLDRLLESMAGIDKTRETFLANVSTACSDAERPVTPTSASWAPPQIRPRLSVPATTKRTTLPRRRNRIALLSHPLVLLLAGSTLAMAVILATTLNKHYALQKRIVDAEQKLRTQQAEIEFRIAADRNSEIVQPMPSTDLKTGNATTEAPQLTLDDPPPQEIIRSVARLTRSTDAVWKKTPKTASLSEGRWELEDGTVDLMMSGGSQIVLEAPVAFELLGPQHVLLERGSLIATVPEDEIGFRVSTPNARIVDLGTQFRVSVDTLGETDVELLRGEVVVVPWNAGAAGKRWHLVADKFDKATVCRSKGVDQNLLASQVSGPSGFQGQIRLAGASMDLTSRSHFDRLRDGVASRLARSPADAVNNWLELTRTFDSTSGSITMNGKEVPVVGLDGVLNFENSLLDTDDFPATGNSQRNSTFVGKVNINGQERTFSSPEEYEAFRKEMFQSLQGFGVPGPAQMQLELDRRKNPFQP